MCCPYRKPHFMNTLIAAYKIFGALLVVCGIAGFFTVADEFRHTGELIGVAAVLFAGIILLAAGFGQTLFKRFAIQWVATGVLASIPFGGIVLDNLPVGVGLGIALGICAAIIFGRKKLDHLTISTK